MASTEEPKSVLDLWERANLVNRLMERRASGELPEMEASAFLAKAIGAEYREGETLLDAGCGAGHFLRSFRFLPERLYTGVDVSPSLVEAGRTHFPQAEFVLGTIEDLPRLGRRFDHVVCSNVLPHVEKLWPALQALASVTTKRLYIRSLIGDQTLLIRHVHNREAFGGISAVEPAKEIGKDNAPREYHHFNIYSKELVEGFLRELSAKRVEIFEDTFFDLGKISSEKKTSRNATRAIDGKMVIGNIICPWAYAFADF